MDHSRCKIQPLPADVKAMIRTGVALTSISQAVEELVLNAIDAKATSIAVRIDLSCFKIQVVDNGQGIPIDQLPLIGERYSTSKCHCVQDLENLNYFGFRGEALASLQMATSLLEIVTRPKGTYITYSKCFQKGKSVGISQSSTHRPSHGTTVSAFDLFFNLPVRQNILNTALEIEKIRYRLAGIALMWPKISITLRDDCVGNVILQTQKCSGVLATFSQLFTPARVKGLVEVSGHNDKFRISGLVSKEGYSRKDLQFVFVNKRLVLKSSIHKQVNKIFKRSLILKRKGVNCDELEKIPQLTHVSNHQGSPSKQVEQYAMFVLNVECSFKEYDITFDPSKTLVEFRDWPKLILTLQDMLYGFLHKEKLLPPNVYPPSRSDVQFNGFEPMASNNHLGNDTDQNHTSRNDFTADHHFGMRNLEILFSEPVCRPGHCASRKPVRFEDKGNDRTVTKLSSHTGPSSETSDKFPTYSACQESCVKRKVCFDIEEGSSASRNDNLSKNSNFEPKVSKAVSSYSNVSQNQSKMGEKHISISHSKIKTQGLFEGYPSNASPLGNDAISECHLVDEEEPVIQGCRSYEIESEHPLESSNKTVKQITLGKGAGYSSSLKNLRDINPFRACTTPKDIPAMMVHTLQDLRMSSRQCTANVNDLLKTPVKAIKRKSLERQQDSSPSKEHRIELETSSSAYVCSSNRMANTVFHQNQMQIDSFQSVSGEENAHKRNGYEVFHADIPSVGQRYKVKTLSNEKEIMKKPVMKKTSHASKLVKIMKGISKHVIESNESCSSNQMTRLKSFTYSKENQYSSDNSCTTSDLLSADLGPNTCECSNVETAGMEVPEQHISHCAHSVVTPMTDNCEPQNKTEINDLPFSVYSTNKEMHINTPKLSVVLSIPIHSDQNREQSSGVKGNETFNPANNLKASPQSSNKDVLQSIPSVIESDKVNEEYSKPEYRYFRNHSGEKAFKGISVDSGEEDCSSETSQGFDIRCEGQQPCLDSPVISPHCANDAQKLVESQGFRIKPYPAESSLGCGISELSNPCPNGDISPMKVNLKHKQSETCYQSSGEKCESRLNDAYQEKSTGYRLVIKDVGPVFEEGETNGPESFIQHQRPHKRLENKFSLSQAKPSDLNVNISFNFSSPTSNGSTTLKHSPSEKAVNLNVQEGIHLKGNASFVDIQDLDYSSNLSKSAAERSMKVERLFINRTKTFESDENIITNSLEVEKSHDLGIDSDIGSSIPCGQEEHKMNITSCSCELPEQRENGGSGSMISCAQNKSMPENKHTGNSDSLSFPLTDSLFPNLLVVESPSNVIPIRDLSVGDEQCLTQLSAEVSDNTLDSQIPDKFKGNGKGRSGENQQQVNNSHESELSLNSSRGEKNNFISLSHVLKETPEGAFKGVSNHILEDMSAVGIIMETDSNKLPADIVSTEKVEDLLGLQRNKDTERALPVLKSMLPTSAVNVCMDLKTTDATNSTCWCRITNPSTVQNHMPQESTEINYARNYEAYGDNSDVFSKWRKEKEPIYDASNGEDVASVISEWTDTVFLKYRLPTELSLYDSMEKNSESKPSSLSQVEFKKEMLQCVQILGQVDNKFIACTIMRKDTASKEDSSSSVMAPVLVFFDQHAVHERVRLELLISDVYESFEACDKERIRRDKISPPLVLQLKKDDVRVMKAFAEEFDRIGIEFMMDEGSRDRIVVTSVPLCMTESKRIKGALKEKIEELITEHIDLLKTTNGACGKLPLAIHRVLCSQACRGAIKFGDPLSKRQCEELLSDLSTCKLPFQCAHGRPSIAPLVSLLDLEMEFKDSVKRPRLQNITRFMKSGNGDSRKV